MTKTMYRAFLRMKDGEQLQIETTSAEWMELLLACVQDAVQNGQGTEIQDAPAQEEDACQCTRCKTHH